MHNHDASDSVQAITRQGLVLYHGTSIESAKVLLAGASLDQGVAASLKIDGPPGFFLATNYLDAVYFALRRSPGGVLQYQFSGIAQEHLEKAGAVLRPIPAGKSVTFSGKEYVIPESAFKLFDILCAAGDITIEPVRR